MKHTNQNQHTRHNRSFILRLWRMNELQAEIWYASLEDPSTKERFGFSSLEALFTFLMDLCEKESDKNSR